MPSRISDPSHALRICQRMVTDDKRRAARRQMVQGDFDGNAPKARADMVRAGRANDNNLNYKRHRGQIMNAWTPFFDMRCEVPVCIDGNIDIGDSSQNLALMRGFAQYFHEMVFGWRGFDDKTQLCDLQMLLHGPGVIAWEDEWNWRPKTILAGNFYVPSQTNGSLDNCERAMIWTPTVAGDLWAKIKEPIEGDGWNVEAVKRVIMDSARGNSQLRNYDWQRWQQAFKNGDQYVSEVETNIIPLFTLFVREMDGTISQKIVPAREPSKGGVQFLYDSPSRYESWDQCTCLFLYDIGSDGTYHSIKGLGTDIHPFCALLNSIDNSIADLITTSIKPMWQPTTNAKMEEFKMGKWGGGNFVPNGISPLQVDISRSIAPALEVSRGFTQTLTANTATANNQDFAAPTVEETAKSAMIRASERAKVSKGLHNRYMRAVSREYSEMWRRGINPELRPHHPGSKEALKFQAKCKRLCAKLSIPWEQTLSAEDSPTGRVGKFTVLQRVENVRANRSLGLGSAAMRIEIVQQLMANIDRFDEIGQIEIKRAFVAVMTSYDGVDAIVPSLTTGRDRTDDEAMAAQENNSMTILGDEAEVLVVPGQDHVLHLQIHIPSAQNDMNGCMQGSLDSHECFKRLEAKGRHAHDHLAILQSNPTKQREAKQFSDALAKLASYQDHLEQINNEQDRAAAQQPQPGEPSPEMAKVQGQLAIKDRKEQADAVRKTQKQQFDQTLAVHQTNFEQTLATRQADFNRRLDALEAAHAITLTTAQAKAKSDTTAATASTE